MTTPSGRRGLRRRARRRQPRRRLRARQSAVACAARASSERFRDVRPMLATREEEAFGIAAGLYLGGAPADRDAAVERPRQLAERAHVAAAAVPDSGADRRQHARRRRRVERRAGADGPRGAGDLRRDRRAARDRRTRPRRAAETVRARRHDRVRHAHAGRCLLPRR